ncbi:MAG TPA: hypothetical protein DEA08_29600, partial [Planctomycetes bacterium]|nr:hypothetical protein [Planctomycetota bacterium]
GLVHRDVKPANCLLTPDLELKVTDFGLVKTAGEEELSGGASSGGAGLTLVDQGMGTPEYAAPEQWAAAGEATPAADLYGLGVVLFELCCGRRPFDRYEERKPAHVLINRHRFERPPDPRELRPDLPPALGELLLRLLDKDPRARPRAGDVRALLSELFETASGASARTEPHLPTRTAAGLCNQALSLFDLGRSDEARRVWEEALETEGGHPESTYDLALVRWRAGELSDVEALSRVETARSSRTGRKGRFLAQLHLERGDGAAALELLEALPEKTRERAEVKEALSLARLRKVELRSLGLPEQLEPAPASWSPERTLQITQAGERLELRSRVTGELVHVLGEVPPAAKRDLARPSLRSLRWFQHALLDPTGHALAGGFGKTLWVWDALSGEQLRALEGSELPLASVGASPCGRWVAAGTVTTGALGDPRMALHLWDLRSGEHRAFPAPSESTSLTRLLVASDGSAHAWANSKRGRAAPYCWSAEGALSYEAPTREAWAAERLDQFAPGPQRRWFRAQTGLSQDGARYLRNEPGKHRVHELPGDRVLYTFPRQARTPLPIAAADYGSSELRPGDLALADLPCFRSRYHAPLALCRALDSKQALERERSLREGLARAQAALTEGRLAEAARETALARRVPGFDRHQAVVEVLEELARVCPRRVVRELWETRTVQTGDPIYACRIDPRGELLATVHPQSVQVWELASGAQVSTQPAAPAGAVRFTPAGELQLGLLRIDPRSGRHRGRLENPPLSVLTLGISSDGRLATSGPARYLWHLPSGRLLRKRPAPTYLQGKRASGMPPVFLPERDLVLRLHERDPHRRVLWDVAQDSEALSLPVQLSRCALDPRGRWVAGLVYEREETASGQDVRQTFGLWDLRTGAEVASERRLAFGLHALAFLPDGRHLALLAHDGLRLCLLPKLNVVHEVPAPSGAKSLALTPDGTRLVTGSDDGSWKLWHLDWQLDPEPPVDWKRAEPLLRRFAEAQRPRMEEAPAQGPFSPESAASFFGRRKVPTWEDADLERLRERLGWAGVGRPSLSELKRRVGPLKLDVSRTAEQESKPQARSGRQARERAASGRQTEAPSAREEAEARRFARLSGRELLDELFKEAREEVDFDTRSGALACALTAVLCSGCTLGFWWKGAPASVGLGLVFAVACYVLFYSGRQQALVDELLLKLLPRLRRHGVGRVQAADLDAWIEALAELELKDALTEQRQSLLRDLGAE